MVSARTTRAKRVQSTTTMATITEVSPAPITAASTIDSSTGGNAIQTSIRREIDLIDPAAKTAGDQAERDADRRRQRRRDQRHRDRGARRIDQARQHAAAETVGAEEVGRIAAMHPGRRQLRRHQILFERIVRRDQRRQQRDQHQDSRPARRRPRAAGRRASVRRSTRRRCNRAIERQGQPWRSLGSSSVTTRSTTRLSAMNSTAKVRTRPWISGKSRLITASIAMLPIPS